MASNRHNLIIILDYQVPRRSNSFSISLMFHVDFLEAVRIILQFSFMVNLR